MGAEAPESPEHHTDSFMAVCDGAISPQASWRRDNIAMTKEIEKAISMTIL